MRALLAAAAVALLCGCPKNSQAPESEVPWGSTEAQPAASTVPAGWQTIGLPEGRFEVLPHATLTTEDGALWIAGSSLKIAQYQWALRIPALGEASHGVYDPGRILSIHSNGTGGISAVGTLGGVPDDKAWFADIDAFGEVSKKQTYLSAGEGQLHDVARREEGLYLAGNVARDGWYKGWLIAAEPDGSDQWKAAYGGDNDNELVWVGTQDAGAAAIGTYRDSDGEDQGWYVRIDSEGQAVAEQHWSAKTWTRLRGAVAHPTGDVIAVGLASETELGPDDGTASLWLGRIAPNGDRTWNKLERDDVSEVSHPVAYAGGLAVVVRTGALGTDDRRSWAVTASADGAVRWVDLALPADLALAEVHAVADELILIAVITDKKGVSWTREAVTLD